MRHGDVERIAAIEQTSPSSWSVPLIVAELDRPQGLQLVATGKDEAIVAWCCGLAAAEAELFKIAVSQLQRRCGVGRALLLRFEGFCRERGCESLFLEVRSDNAAATGLYVSLGYSAVGCRTNYYSDPQDDALILRKSFL